MAGVALVLIPTAAAAQEICDERAGILEVLAERHGETPVAMGIDTAGNLVEVLASKQGTWTFLITKPGGETCLAGTGDGWRRLRPTKEGPAA